MSNETELTRAIDPNRAEAYAKVKRWRGDALNWAVEVVNLEPDPWQAEALRRLSATRRLCLKACKGPGKTAFLALAIWWFLMTHYEPRVGATSITGDNLRDNLWAELAKWRYRSTILQRAFEWTASRIQLVGERGEVWYASARTWPRSGDREAQAHALAGLHAENTMFVLDESGGIPQSVMTTAEAVLATGKDVKVLQAGNPTHLEGPLHRACTVDSALWDLIEISGDPELSDDDPRRSPRIRRDYAREEIKKWGRDNPWVQVNILGNFPKSSLNTLLGPDEVREAMARVLDADLYRWAQKRLGIDVARFGDDRTVIFPRQGLAAFRPVVMRNARTDAIAARVALAKSAWGSEMELVDDTGGWGHGVIDQLLAAQHSPIGIQFHAPALDPQYFNRRTEMWMSMAKWVQGGGALPNLPDLVGELVTPTYTFFQGQFRLEEKDQIKARIGRSPDLADGLGLTFAFPDMPAAILEEARSSSRAATEFDPLAHGQEG